MKLNRKYLILIAFLALGVVTLSIWQMLMAPKSRPSAPETQITSTPVTEEDAQSLAQHFLISYFTYVSGDFANLEALYEQMTPTMAAQEKARVERLRQEALGKPRTYITSLVVIKHPERDIKLVESSEKVAIFEITVARQIGDGARLYNVEEDYEYFVDKNGNAMDYKLFYQNMTAVMETYRLILIKQQIEGWKTNDIVKIS